MYILALESSTTSAKAMIYDTETGAFEAKAKAYVLSQKDVTKHNAKSVFEQTAALGKSISEGKKIDIVTLGGAYHGLMLLNKQLEPQTDVYPWSNTEAAQICTELRKDKAFVNWFYQKTGCMVNAIYPAFKIKYLESIGYCLKDYLFAGQGTYNTNRLTGEWVVTDSMASGSGLLNIHKKEYEKDVLAYLGVDEKQFPRLITYQEPLTLSVEGAELLGITAGIPVIATNPDGGLNQVGAGAIEEGVMSFSVGTSGAMRLTTNKPVIPQTPSTWCYLSPKAWLSGAATSGCCNCIDWFKQKAFGENVSYAEIEKGIGSIENIPVFLPFLFGERCPGWNDERRGAFFDIKPEHTLNDMYQGVQEGILFNLYQCFQVLTKLNGRPKKIKLSGGILHSQRWTQMCADIFGEAMELDQAEHSSLLGSVALAMERLLVLEDAKDFCTSSVKTVIPNKEMAGIYARKFQRYQYWYDKTQ